MISRRTPLIIENKIVVVFDICSSSNIIEDLTLTDNLERFRDMLLVMKRYLKQQAGSLGFEVYKFTGDGWILLFRPDVEAGVLMQFLTTLSRIFREHFTRRILPLLQTEPQISGLSFGIDQGELMKMVLVNRTEYVGRALNTAFRLQGAIKEKDPRPMYKVLSSRPVFRTALGALKQYRPLAVSRTLRNIGGGTRHQCIKLRLPV